MEISLQTVDHLIEKAIEQANSEFKRPVCIAICDPYGFLIAFKRMSNAPIRSIAISQGKAYTAARMGVNTDAFLERLNRENVPASYFCDERLTALPGGAVLKDAAGAIVGGIAVSGLVPYEDQIIANALAALVQQG